MSRNYLPNDKNSIYAEYAQVRSVPASDINLKYTKNKTCTSYHSATKYKLVERASCFARMKMKKKVSLYTTYNSE